VTLQGAVYESRVDISLLAVAHRVELLQHCCGVQGMPGVNSYTGDGRALQVASVPR